MNIALTGIFMAGVLTFFTPCVLPLIPIYLTALAGSRVGDTTTSGRGQLLVRSLLFAAGFVAVFSALGLGAAEIGASLSRHRAVLQFAGASVIFVFGLKSLGVVQIPLLDRVLRADDGRAASRAGALNALFMGFVFAAGWSPCVGPILGSVLTYTASRTSDALTGAWYLTVYGAGFAAPLLLTALFAEAGLKLLRRLSRFLPVFEKVMGVLMLVAAVSMFYDLGPSAAFPGLTPAAHGQAPSSPACTGPQRPQPP